MSEQATIDSTAEEIGGDEQVGQEIEVREQQRGAATLFRTDDPAEVVTKATAVADSLKGVLDRQGLTKRISNRDHVMVEGWQTVGTMIGVFPVPQGEVEVMPWPDIDLGADLKGLRDAGKSFGFVARYNACTADGRIVGGGEARCTRTESTWRSRDDYALASMAQTRAQSKALKAPLGFIVALAGYSATPAEEMPEQASGPPHGPEASAQLKESTAKAVGYILDSLDIEGVGAATVLEAVCKQFGDYLPAASAGALVILGKTIKEQRGDE